MRILNLVFLFFCYSNLSYSQEQNNLVPNSSFEFCKELPESYCQSHLLRNWYSCRINASPVTYFNSKSYYPKKIVGRNQVPHGGDAFIGLGIDLKDKLRNSQFIGTVLKKPLVKDSTYKITLYACLGEDFKYSIDHLECSFFQREFLYTTKMNFDQEGIITLLPEPADDPTAWVKFTTNYKAKGDENYLVIGNFSFSYKKKKQPFKFTLLHFITHQTTYYFIDDVSIAEISPLPSPTNDNNTDEFPK
jgi:OOP family OmpA-OmpF porin